MLEVKAAYAIKSKSLRRLATLDGSGDLLNGKGVDRAVDPSFPYTTDYYASSSGGTMGAGTDKKFAEVLGDG